MALTPAEKQRRYRERLKAGSRPVRYRHPKDRRSKPQRWHDAVDTLIALQAHYRNWLQTLPEGLRDTAVHAKLQAIDALDIDALHRVELPRGFGQD